MPNSFAYLMLFAWPLVALALFRAMPVYKALIWTILGGYLLLPSATAVKLPMIPALDKHSITVVTAFILCRVYASPQSEIGRPSWTGSQLVATLLLCVLFSSPFVTVMTNPDPIIAGPRTIPGLRAYDAISIISATIIGVLPFFLARRHLNTPVAHREILRALVVCGLAYSLPALLEVRLSPQLHVWIYGFFPHDFVQHIRAGGFRPIVFLNHGLMVGIFFSTSVLAALSLWREARREGAPAFLWFCAALWLLVTLVLVKSVGALAITAGLGLVVFFARPRMQIWVGAAVAGIVLLYPTLRGADLIPVDEIMEIAQSYSADRAQSLKFRLDNEDALLAHANQRPVWGWGSWGRNQLYDPETGYMTSVTDGIWVILIGVYGWTGYIAYFGLLTLPLLRFAMRRGGAPQSFVTSGLLMVLCALLIDFLPNAGLVPYVWLYAGALVGLVVQPVSASAAERAAPPVKPSHRPTIIAASWRHTASERYQKS